MSVRVDFLERGLERLAGATGSRLALALDLHRRTAIAPGLDHVPLDVIGEHAQEDVRAHAALESVMDRTDLQIHGFQGTERPFDLGERFVTAHGLGRRTSAFSVSRCG